MKSVVFSGFIREIRGSNFSTPGVPIQTEMEILDLRRYELVEAHKALGEAVRQPVWNWLRRKLDELESDEYVRRLRQSRVCLSWATQQCARLAADHPLRAAFLEYLGCLSAWADGARLEMIAHPRLRLAVDDRPVSALDRALLLQHDNQGCQTGLYRLADGSGLLWHSEEDGNAGRFDKMRIAIMEARNFPKVGGSSGYEAVEFHAFIYPDLLPGPAFGWRSDGCVQAVDNINLYAAPDYPYGCLANLAAWLALRLGPLVSTQEIVSVMMPFYDGYAINRLYPCDSAVCGEKYEFGGQVGFGAQLGDAPGSSLFQVNIFSRRDDPALLALEGLEQTRRHALDLRYRRTMSALHRKPPEASAEAVVDYFYRLLCSRRGGEMGYANLDVQAYLLAHLENRRLRLWTGAGPAQRGKLGEAAEVRLRQ